ncbi:unnamed protein product [Amoebophrya sp. A120]|nr:unnamed protein product [Amoebophrya sp. A120]|eukprot:GSA120T00016588001.1
MADLQPLAVVLAVGFVTAVFVFIVEQTLHIGGVNEVDGKNIDDYYFIAVLQGFYVFALAICLLDMYTHKVLLKQVPERLTLANAATAETASRIVNIVYALSLVAFLVLPPGFAVAYELFGAAPASDAVGNFPSSTTPLHDEDSLPVGTVLSVVPPICLALLFFLDHERYCRRQGTTVFLPAVVLAYDGKYAPTAAGKLRTPGTIALLQFYLMSIYLHTTCKRFFRGKERGTRKPYPMFRVAAELIAVFLLFLSPLAVMSLLHEIQLLTLNGPWYAFVPIYVSLLLLTVCHHGIPMWDELFDTVIDQERTTSRNGGLRTVTRSVRILENVFHLVLLFYLFSHAWWGIAYRDWLLGLPGVSPLVLLLACFHVVALCVYGKNSEALIWQSSSGRPGSTALGTALLGGDRTRM